MSDFFSKSNQIRESNLDLGIKGLKSRIRGMNIEAPNPVIKEAVEPERKYTEIEVAENIYNLYKDRVAPTAPDDEPLVVANTHAMKVNAKALMRSLAGYRNFGSSGTLTHFTHQCNGDVGSNNPDYNALVVAGTEMTLEETQPETIDEFRERINGVMEACWAGYKQKGNKKMFGKTYPNCVKEEEEELEEGKKVKSPIDMALETDKKLMKLHTKDKPAPKDYHKESVAVEQLKDELMEMDDHSWQSIDKVMRVIAKEHKITPKQLHKDFKAENDGQIPDEWIKENRVMEEAGWMPLDEAVALNKVGNVYEVTGMWHAHTRRIKFFVPTVGIPSRDEIQYYFEMFFPGGKVISHYPSMHPGDNVRNEMVVVVPIKEEWVELEQRSWVEMTDEESLAYEMICEEEGEPISPAMITDDGFELWIEDHDTGEERVVIYEGGLHDWFSKSKSKDGKPGWVQSDGSPCANEKGETKTPKCYSSQRLAALKRKGAEGKKLIRSADARKSRQDPGQQQKSGGAKPTYVKTFKDKKDFVSSGDKQTDNAHKEEFETLYDMTEGKKDACYHKVKSRYKVWPSAYASGALVKCRKAGAGNWGNSTKKEEFEYMEEGTPAWQRKEGKNPEGGLNAKGVASYRAANPGSKLKTAVTTDPSKLKKGSKAANRRKSFCARMSGMKKRLTSAKTANDPDSRINKSLRKWNC